MKILTIYYQSEDFATFRFGSTSYISNSGLGANLNRFLYLLSIFLSEKE